MKKFLAILCLTFIITTWYSCTKDSAPAPAPVQTGNCDSTKVNYTKDLLPIINSTCTGSTCHSSGTGNLDFTIYSVTKGDIETILCRIRAVGVAGCGARMPQGQPALDTATTGLFKRWQDDGFYDCH